MMGQNPAGFLASAATNPALAHVQQVGGMLQASTAATAHQNGKRISPTIIFDDRYIVEN